MLLLGTPFSLHSLTTNISLKKKVITLNAELEATKQTLQQKVLITNNDLITKLDAKSALLKHYENQITTLRQDQEELLENSVSRLDKRSKIIEALIDTIGIKVKIEEDAQHSGGIFIPSDGERISKKLLSSTDKYIEIVQKVPFGRPVNTSISSKFGHRTDPLNKKKAFHEGLDFRGRTGDKISATGNGVVIKSIYSKGWGNHIVIDHQNGYKTLFAHMSKRLVKKGERIERGQIIGLLGNTGRSTGSHLHYEIRLDNKPINPMKFVKVTNLSMTVKN